MVGREQKLAVGIPVTISKSMKANSESEEIYQSLMRLDHWVTKAEWKAYDTFDGLSSPLAPIFTFGHPLLRQVWQQGVRRFPVNLRPVLGIKPDTSTKGMGFFAQGYLKLYETYGNKEFLSRMKFCLDWLVENRSPEFKGYCWGNHFEYQARSGRIPKGTPTVVWTGLIGHAFMDAFESLGDKAYLEVAEKICQFIYNELGWEVFDEGWCIRYHTVAKTTDIHNSSVIGASLLARLSHHTGNQKYMELAEKAIRFTVYHQLKNGGWYYGVDPKHHWVDSFHTGYVLESIYYYNRYSGDRTYQASLQKGYQFYIDTFFAPDGLPRYYDTKTRPLDIQCASQGIQTLVNLSDLNPQSVGLAVKVARWTIKNMQDKSGYFYYRKYPLITNKTPTLHWGQATMFAALSVLAAKLNPKQSPPISKRTEVSAMEAK
jgi:rhamnogalacturonyl hydrolase YesR